MNAIPVLLLGLVVGLVVGVLIEYFHSKKYKVLADKFTHENTYLQMQIELLKEQKEREIQLIKEKSETEQNTLKVVLHWQQYSIHGIL